MLDLVFRGADFAIPFLLWLCEYASDLIYNFAICTALKCILAHTAHRNNREKNNNNTRKQAAQLKGKEEGVDLEFDTKYGFMGKRKKDHCSKCII